MDLGEEDSEFIAQAEQDILDMYPPINDMKVKMRLDKFFFSELPASPFGKIMEKMSVVGGARKVAAAERIAEIHGIGLADLAVIGDSITDFKMLKAANEAGGLAVAFNGNQYALECGTVGVASMSLAAILPLLRVWESGGLEGARDFVSRLAKDAEAPGAHYHWLAGVDIAEALAVHARLRRLVRQQAAALG